MAIDAIGAASAPHNFLSVTKYGHSAIVQTSGNEDCHIILRGGKEPNYSAAHVKSVNEQLTSAKLPNNGMIDFSHANSSKQFKRQLDVATDVSAQMCAGDDSIFGVMIESHLVEGRQDIIDGEVETYGMSVTDACIGWDDTELVMRQLAQAVTDRNKL